MDGRVGFCQSKLCVLCPSGKGFQVLGVDRVSLFTQYLLKADMCTAHWTVT